METFDDSGIVKLISSRSKRFYEALIILVCLGTVLGRIENGSHTFESESISDRSLKAIFECFVNKLSQICDNVNGGDTVTAFAVLHPGSIEYRFTCNRRKKHELAETTRYVTRILTMLGQASNGEIAEATRREDAPLFSMLILEILEFNRPRLTNYIDRELVEHLEFCIGICNGLGRDEDTVMEVDLRSIQFMAELTLDETMTGPDFAISVHSLLRTISERYRRQPFRGYLSEKTREHREVSTKTPWTEVYHAIGRLHSYTIAVKVFLATRGHWPELFEDFVVRSLPSSKEADTPNVRKQSSKIIETLGSNTSIPDAFNDLTPWREQIVNELDTEISNRTKRGFNPIVHAEVNLVDDILREERDPASEGQVAFFNENVFGCRYVGSSKPTCRLCELYFQAPFFQASDRPRIAVRPGHHNLYRNWRAPDVFVKDGTAVAKTRDSIYEWMIVNLKTQVAATVTNRFAIRTSHDSNTYPSNPLATERGTMSVRDMNDLASMMGQVDLDPRDE